MRRLEVIGGFLQGLADHGIDQRLAVFEVPGRLIESQAGFGFLLDQKEFAVALDDGGNSHMGFPDHGEAQTAKALF